jgi:hypothetical protein
MGDVTLSIAIDSGPAKTGAAAVRAELDAIKASVASLLTEMQGVGSSAGAALGAVAVAAEKASAASLTHASSVRAQTQSLEQLRTMVSSSVKEMDSLAAATDRAAKASQTATANGNAAGQKPGKQKGQAATENGNAADEKPAKQKGQATQMQQWSGELEAMKVAHAGTLEAMQVKEEEFWRAKAALATKGSTDQVMALKNADKGAEAIHKQALSDVLANMEEERAGAQKGSQERIDIAEAEALVLVNTANVSEKEIRDAEKRVTEAKREEVQTRKQLAAEEASTEVQLKKIGLAEERDKLDAEVAMGDASASEKYATLRDLADQEYRLDLDTLARKKDLAKGDVAAEQAAQDQILVLSANYNRQLTQMDRQQAQERAKDVASWTAPIGSAMNSMIAGYMQGTQTLKQVAAKSAQAIAVSYAQKAAGAVANWAQEHILMAAISSMFGAKEVGNAAATTNSITALKAAAAAQQTTIVWSGSAAEGTAVAAGEAAKTTALTAGAEEGLLIKAGSAIKSIAISAYEAAAGAYASVSAIPFVGWALAPVVAAGALAAVVKFGSSIASAEGGWGEVDQDGRQTILHKQEMVLPAKYATPLRAMLTGPAGGTPSAAANVTAPALLSRPTGGAIATVPQQQATGTDDGAGDTHVHFHVNAIDAKGVQGFLDQHGPKIAKTVQQQARNFSPSTRKA